MNAIILAAGKGTRLQPFTNTTPKPLLPILGVPIIERQIQFLLEKNIQDIYIVIGFFKEKFLYLKEKYGVQLIENPYYATYNNFTSLKVVEKHLCNSYIIEGDVYMRKNIFQSSITTSTYFSRPCPVCATNEWKLHFDFDHRVQKITADKSEKGDYILSGISFWNKDTSHKIKKYLAQIKIEPKNKDLFWDSIIVNHIDTFDIFVLCLNEEEICEIDTAEEYMKWK